MSGPAPNTGPGLRITDVFADIVTCAAEDDPYLDVDPLKFADKAVLLSMCAGAIASSGLCFVHAVKDGARCLTVDGEDLQRQRVYALVPLGQEAEAVRGVVQFIARKHGPGRLWTHGGVPIGPLKRRDQDGYRGMQVGGVLHVVMGCYYYHRAEGPATRADIKPGDAVRWWPDGHDGAGQAVSDRYIDGTVTAQSPLCIKVTGSHGFTERIPGGWRLPAVGGVVDTSVSPGTIQRLNQVERRPYAPGEKMTDRHPDSVIAQVVEETIEKWIAHLATPIAVRGPYAPLPAPSEPAFRLFEQDGALYVDTKAGPVKITADPTLRLNEVRLDNGVGVFHIEPDPPDLAQRQAARVAERMAKEGALCIEPWMKPAPVAPELLAQRDRMVTESYERCGLPAVPAGRPDGFDQHQVDAARAALLAPATPRYPRPR